MKVVLTGASGFLGKYVLDCLLEEETEVVVMGRVRPHGYEGGFVAADLCQATEQPDFKELGATHLLHLAWYTEHGKYWNSLENSKWVVATQDLVKSFCEAGGRHVTVAGTCAEYDPAAEFCTEGQTLLAPASIYGMAKNLSRGLVAEICRAHDVTWTWGRIFQPFGPGENRSRLLPSLMDVYTKIRPPFPVGLNSERDFLHARDVALALVRLLSPAPGNCYNICSGQGTTIRRVIQMVAAMHGGDENIFPDSAPASDAVTRLVGSNQRLKSLGWKPTISLEDALQSGEGW